MTDDELNAMIAALRNATAFGRLSLVEVETAFSKQAELGYIVTKPTPAND